MDEAGLMVGAQPLCALHRFHSPRPNRYVRHHIVPKVWGGSDDQENIAIVCDTGHYSVHILIDRYVLAGGDPGWKVKRSFGPFERVLARLAWEGRPSDRAPMLTLSVM